MSIFTVSSLCSCSDTANSANDSTTENTIESDNKTDEAENNEVRGDGEVHQLTTSEFKEKVFNYDKDSEWNYLGDKPCVIDFYADWCKPCKMVAPIMEELANDYDGEVIFYKIDVDKEKELAQYFGIRSIPSILFIPGDNSQPQMSTGAMQKQGYVDAINSIFKL